MGSAGIAAKTAARVSPGEVADALYSAMKGLGTDESGVYAQLGKVRRRADDGPAWDEVQREFLRRHPDRDKGNLRRALMYELTGAGEMDKAIRVLYSNGVDWYSSPADIVERGEPAKVTKARAANEQLLDQVRQAAGNPHITMASVRIRSDQYRELRGPMVEAIDSIGEKLFDAMQQNKQLNVAEAWLKNKQLDLSGDAFGTGEARVKWGRWGRKVKFGEAMREAHFSVPQGYLDGATLGATPGAVRDARRQWDELNQRNPVMWRFRSLPFRLTQAESCLARFLGADPDDTKIVLNGRHAVSTVLRALPWCPGDRVLLLSTAGAAQLDAAAWLRRRHGVAAMRVDVALPADDAAVVAAVAAALKAEKAAGRRAPVVACVDHVVPGAGCPLPVAKLCGLFRSYSVSCLVDGSLAVGHLDFTVSSIGADWYVGCAHHWLYTCPGVGFMVVLPHKHRGMMPLTVSYFDGQGYAREFAYYGLQCWSSWLAVIEALQFPEEACGGWPAIRKYCAKLASDGVGILTSRWETPHMHAPGGMLPVVQLPEVDGLAADAHGAAIATAALRQHGVQVKVLLLRAGAGPPRLCVRCTCQVWNTPADFALLAEAWVRVRHAATRGPLLAGPPPDRAARYAAAELAE